VLSALGSIWVANQLDATVARLDPSTGSILALVHVGEGPSSLAAAAGHVWVANELDDSVNSIDPATDTVVETMHVGGAAAFVAADGEGLWLGVGASALEHRGGTLTVSSAYTTLDSPSLDPAVVGINDSVGGQVLAITNDGLLGYRKVGGPAGAALVPDLASALPHVSDDGLTYRFPLREGIRYSTGEPLRPEDFRYAIERTLAIAGEGSTLFDAIDGADVCQREPSTCDLSDSIVVDQSSVTFHLAVPDPDLPFKLALPAAYPVPVGTPFEDQGYEPLPATGPYMIAEAGDEGVELVRNPAFEEWSAIAQPDGFVEAISWRFSEDVGSAFDRLGAGELDWMVDPPSPEDLASLQVAHPDQVVLWPRAWTNYVGFNLRTPPFDDERVRMALSYAIDRDHVVELLGGTTSQRLTCQIVPPNLQGYEPFCPFTLEPESGAWSAPDMDQARALIEDVGAKGARVVAWVGDDPNAQDTMEYVVHIMNEVGLRATLDVVHGERYSRGVRAGDSPVYLFGWVSNYPSAVDFIDAAFRCGAPDNYSGLCSESLDAQMDEAQRLQATDLGAANQAWIEIEHRLVEDAVWVPLTNTVFAFAVSERVDNAQVHPVWGILPSQLWVR
jgi:peptide/nickel transport system substrate-binding protein